MKWEMFVRNAEIFMCNAKVMTAKEEQWWLPGSGYYQLFILEKSRKTTKNFDQDARKLCQE